MDWLKSLGLTSAQIVTAGIAVLALVVSVISIVLGEVRALQTRRINRERREVLWRFSWPEPEVLRVENVGEDEARQVLIIVRSESIGELRLAARRIKAHRYVEARSQELGKAWKIIEAHYAQVGGLHEGGGAYREPFYYKATWRSPLKTPDRDERDGNVTRQIDLDEERESIIRARAQAEDAQLE